MAQRVMIPGQEALGFDDRRLPEMVGVTEVGKTVVGAAGLLDWAWKAGRSGRTLNQSAASKRARGTAVHGVLKALHEGKVVHTYDFKADQRPFVEGMLHWEERTRPRILATEVPVEDRELGVHGRIDVIRKCEGCDSCSVRLIEGDSERREPGRQGFGVIVLDCKSGSLVPTQHDHLQVGGAYVYLHRHVAPNTHVCGAEILCINDKGEYRVHPAESSPEAFLAAVAWYRHLARIPNPFA
jgi:hypothetical protein